MVAMRLNSTLVIILLCNIFYVTRGYISTGSPIPTTEPGLSSSTISEPETITEPEITPEPVSENPTAENEPTVTGIPEEENTAVSEAETGTGEPENATPEGTPEAVVTGQPEAETGTAEPESVTPEGTPEAENTEGPEAETGTAEPESVTPEGTPEAENTEGPEAETGTAEPESVTPESELAGTAESETGVYVESNGEPTPEAEVGTAEAEWEPYSEGMSETKPEPEERPSIPEIILPPFTLVAIIIIGLCLLSLWTQRRVWIHLLNWTTISKVKPVHLTNRRPVCGSNDLLVTDLTSQDNLKEAVQVEEETFLSPFDKEVLTSMGTFNSRPAEMFRIAGPALISLALCPATLYLYLPLVTLFWPPDKFVAAPNINEAIACFLAPAGLVYATSFGFAFQQALGKKQEVMHKITYELGLLDQITTLASKLSLPSLKHRMNIYKAVKAEAVFMILQIGNRDSMSFKNTPVEDVKVKIWSILDELRNITSNNTNTFNLDRILAEKTVSHMLQLNSICSDRMGTFHTRIHPLKWAFLESLGFFSFFGILLLHAESFRMELIMCIITVFSISLLCYVVSDLDSPFSGFFKVDLSVLPDVIRRANIMYEHAQQGHNVLCNYPDATKE